MKFQAQIQTIEFFEPDTGFLIARALADSSHFRVIMQVPAVDEGETLELDGEFIDHDLFGHCLWAHQAIGSEVDKALLDLDLDVKERKAVKEAVESKKDVDIYEVLPSLKADKIAVALGKDKRDRINMAIDYVMRLNPHGTDQMDVIEMCHGTLGLDVSEIQTILEKRLKDDLMLLPGNLVVPNWAIESADALIKKAPKANDLSFVDDDQWRRLEEVPGLFDGLTESCKLAVKTVLNYRWVVVDLMSPLHEEQIQEAVLNCINVMGHRDDIKWLTTADGDQVKAETVGDGRVVIFHDMRRMIPLSPTIKALVDARAAVLARVTPYPGDRLAASKRAISSSAHKIILTARSTDDDEVEFAADAQGDYSVWHINYGSPARNQEKLCQIYQTIGADECQVIAFRGAGELGAHQLTEALARSTRGNTLPLEDKFFVGDKLIDRDTGDVHIVDGDLIPFVKEDINRFDAAYVLHPTQMRLMNRTWDTVILAIDNTADAAFIDWRYLYGALCLADDQLILVGDEDAIVKLRQSVIRERRNEALYQGLVSP